MITLFSHFEKMKEINKNTCNKKQGTLKQFFKRHNDVNSDPELFYRSMPHANQFAYIGI
jgi:hypothetical protein